MNKESSINQQRRLSYKSDKMESVVRFCPEVLSGNVHMDEINNSSSTGDSSHCIATAIMREFDGDILELGVEELESNNATPVTQPHLTSSNPPTLDLSCSSIHSMDDDIIECQSETLPSSTPKAASTGCQEEEEVKSKSQKIASVEISLLSDSRTESNLFFPVNSSSNNNNSESNNTDVIIHNDSHPIQQHEKSQSSEDSLIEAKSKLSQIMHRSKSYDRRLSEATQYYESVGEIPPTYEDDIIRGVVIEEDTSSDDDDDDDEDDENDAGSVVLSSSLNPDIDVHTPSEFRRHSLLSTCEETEEKSTSPSKTVICDETSPSSDLHDDVNQSLPTGEPSHSSNLSVQTVGEEPASAGLPTTKTPTTTDTTKTIKRYSPFTQRSSLSSIGPTLLAIRTGCNTDQQTNYVYKGIRHNPPEITKRGISRGNFAQLHRKAWLEVSDKYHRYGKNLRLYYKHWEKLGHPTNMFFDWLDSKGEAAGQPLPNLPECPRAVLDSDTVLYITNPEKQERYKFKLVSSEAEKGVCLIIDENGDPLYTGSQGWIFVLRDQELYAAPKVTSVSGKAKQRFHHSSFFGGKAVVFAGILITDQCGRLKSLYPHSGHYRPGEAHMQRMVFFLHHTGVDLSSILIDMQQIMRVSREKSDMCTPKGGKVVSKENEDPTNTHQVKTKKAKKSDSLYMKSGTYVALFLGHKASMIEHGVFHHLHKIKRVGGMSVSRILDQIDNGGIWNRKNHYQIKVSR